MPLSQLLAQPAENHEELTARQHIADQLERRFIPRPLCKSSLIAEFNNELKILKEAVHSGSGAGIQGWRGGGKRRRRVDLSEGVHWATVSC